MRSSFTTILCSGTYVAWPYVLKALVWFGAMMALGSKILPVSATLTWKPTEET